MKINLIMGGVLVACFVFLVFALSRAQFGFESTKSQYELTLGKYVLLEKDTLRVVDYSMFTETLKLSNGKEININLFKELQVLQIKK